MTKASMVIKTDERLVAVLHLVEKRGPVRFTDIATELGLRPAQVNRALKGLALNRLLEAHVEPGTYPNAIRYRLSEAGKFELEQVRIRIKSLKSHAAEPLRAEARRLEKVMA
jgi:DNA-binding PadR family transcriptional regulator